MWAARAQAGQAEALAAAGYWAVRVRAGRIAERAEPRKVGLRPFCTVKVLFSFYSFSEAHVLCIVLFSIQFCTNMYIV